MKVNKSLQTVLVINSGSSSLKFSLFLIKNPTNLKLLYKGEITHIGENNSSFSVHDNETQTIHRAIDANDHKQALQQFFHWFNNDTQSLEIVAVGHRIVHGGIKLHQPTLLSEQVIDYLKTLIPLAPNHQPANLQAVDLLNKLQPTLPQIACFDTAFHASRPDVEQFFALPKIPALKDIRRYGFHGLSYEYIASVLPDYLGEQAQGKIIVAHLGYGASLCAIKNRRSMATTMTFTPLDGIPMATRSGSIDPAVVLYLQQQGMTNQQISDLLYFQSGLLGVSGISGDLQTLLNKPTPESRFAIELFIHNIVRAIGSLAATLGGLDALIFTGGIGENEIGIRAAIAEKCKWLGLKINAESNEQNKPCISHQDSKLSAWVIRTNEELIIAQYTLATLNKHDKD
ncbi:MAG: acetate/propionate family kinase [Methylophaga sp.]|nr:acetate/propionate family kinase [Methylophaga sp.]